MNGWIRLSPSRFRDFSDWTVLSPLPLKHAAWNYHSFLTFAPCFLSLPALFSRFGMCVDGLEWTPKTVPHSTRPTFLPSRVNREQPSQQRNGSCKHCRGKLHHQSGQGWTPCGWTWTQRAALDYAVPKPNGHPVLLHCFLWRDQVGVQAGPLTRRVCAITKCDITEPKPDKPNDGIFTIHVQLTPMGGREYNVADCAQCDS